MDKFNFKRISDPVHGTIGLSKLEVRIIDTRVFQRLRNIKQLGLAYYVYPGADYSRFSHSIGVCHVQGKIWEAILKKQPELKEEVDDKKIQIFRLASLLHDIGHYPFSHAMEDAIKDHYSKGFFEEKSTPEKSDNSVVDGGLPKYLEHESVGKEILTKDTEMNSILKEERIEGAEIASIFRGEKETYYTSLISSDLDADRIDYLLRTAHHTGLPYGNIDLEYLLSQMRIDKEKRFCLEERAIRTADHFLLSRYFDYQQVAFHKTVSGLEMVLKDLLSALFEKNLIKCAREDITQKIDDGSWAQFDDLFILNKFRELENDENEILKLKSNCILKRDPPNLIGKKEYFAFGNKDKKDEYNVKVQLLNTKIPEWAERFKLDQNLIYLWKLPGMKITSIGSDVTIYASEDEGKDESENIEKLIKICDLSSDTSKPIVSMGQSLLNILGIYASFSLRLYILLPKDREDELEEIRKTIVDDVSTIFSNN